MRVALALARACKPSESALSVGAVIVGPDGLPIGRGFSRETGPSAHAEEVALRRAGPAVPAGSTLFVTVDPCGRRLSRRRSCAERIAAAGIRCVYVAAEEPPVFVRPTGAARLARAGVEVVRLRGHAAAALAVNAHLLAGRRAGRSPARPSAWRKGRLTRSGRSGARSTRPPSR